MSEEPTVDPQDPQNNTGGDGGDLNGGDPQDPQTSWVNETLSESFHENESIKGFETPDALAQAYLDAQGKIPQVPESADAYEIESDESNEQLVGEFKNYAHEIGLTQEQAKKLVDFNNGKLASLTEQANAKHKEAMDALKSEWGTAWDQNIDNSRKAVSLVEKSVPGLKEFLDSTGLGDNPTMIKAFADIGKRMGEGEFVKGEHKDHKRTTRDGRSMLSFPSMQDM